MFIVLRRKGAETMWVNRCNMRSIMLSKSTQTPSLGTSRNSNEVLLKLPTGAITRLGRGMVDDLEFSADSKSLAVATRTGFWWYSLASMSPTVLRETERGMVCTISCSSDGRWFAIGTLDGILKVWDMRNEVCVAQLDSQCKVSTGVRHTFSPDGQYLAAFVLGTDMIYLIDPGTGRVRATLGDEKTIINRRPAGKPIAFSVDGKFLAHVSPSKDMSSEFVYVSDVETGACITYLTEHLDYVYGLCFSPCGHFLCIGCWNGRLIVWDIFKGRLALKRIQYGKYRMYPCYSSTGQLIAAGLYQYYTHKPVDMWRVDNDEKLDEIDINGYPTCACFSKGGTQLAIATHDQIKVWNWPEKDRQSEAESGLIGVSRKEGSEANFSRSVTFFRQRTIENPTIPMRAAIFGHTGVVDSIVFSQDGKKVVAGYKRDNLLVWDVGSQSSQRPYDAHPIFQSYIVQTSPSGEIFSVGVNQDLIQVWDCINGRNPIAEFTFSPELLNRRAVALAPEANLLVVGNMSGQLDVWDVQCRHKRYTLIGHETPILSIKFSPDGKRIVSGGRDRTVRLWDVETGEEISTLPMLPLLNADIYKGNTCEIQSYLKWISTRKKPIYSRVIIALAFSPCGNLIAGGMEREIRLWDATTYDPRLLIVPPHGCQRPFSFAFSPCGRYLAVGAWWDGTRKVSIRLWDVATGENIATFWGTQPMFSVLPSLRMERFLQVGVSTAPFYSGIQHITCSMKFYDVLTSGVANIQQNKLRASLSILGILIGIASVLCMIAIGEGAEKIIADDLERLGGANHVQFSTRTAIYRRDRISLLMFVPWLYLISPAYRSGSGFSTHVAALMLLPPLTILVLRGARYLLLKHVEQLRPHPLKLAWGLTLLSVAAGVGYIFMQAGTFAETAYPFRESQLMQNVGELGDPNFRFWASRYGTVFVLGSLGLIGACFHLWKWKGLPLVLSLSLFVGTTFFRTQVNGWIDADTCNTLFFVSLGLTVLSLGIACLRKEIAENELVTLAMLAWFLLWVGLARGGKRHDFFIGLPLAYGTAWFLYFSPVHLIQRLKDANILYPHVKERLATAIFTIIALIAVLFWTPIGGHATKSVYAAACMRPPVPRQNSRSEVFKWMHDTLPRESVIAANWDYGTQLNVLGGVRTVVDSDHFLPHWIYLYYRHVFSAQDAHEALEFLKTHKTTHLMLTEREVLSRSRNYSSMGSDENSDRQFELYQLTRTETPIGTPYRMQPRGRGTPLDFIEIARTSPDTVSITAHFKDENEAVAEGELGESLTKDVTVKRTVNTPTSQISVDIEDGGLVLDFDAETRLNRAYYIPPLGWNSLAVKLFLRGEHKDIFVPIYPTADSTAKDIKVWEIRYPPDIETDEKYLATEPMAANKE